MPMVVFQVYSLAPWRINRDFPLHAHLGLDKATELSCTLCTCIKHSHSLVQAVLTTFPTYMRLFSVCIKHWTEQLIRKMRDEDTEYIRGNPSVSVSWWRNWPTLHPPYPKHACLGIDSLFLHICHPFSIIIILWGMGAWNEATGEGGGHHCIEIIEVSNVAKTSSLDRWDTVQPKNFHWTITSLNPPNRALQKFHRIKFGPCNKDHYRLMQ